MKKEAPDRVGHRRASATWLLALASTLFVLLSAEVVVRVAAADRPRPTGYAPVNTALRVNRHESSRGYRDIERPLTKPPGTRRVVVLGDSFTWGVGVMFESTYPHLLENALRARRGETWEVVSLALRGMNTVEEAAKLSDDGVRYDPDLVLVGYCLNDAEGQDSAEARRAQDWIERSQQRPPNRSWLDRSALFGLVSARIEATLENRRRVANFKAMYAAGAPGWASACAAFRNMADLCRQREIPLVVAIWPLFGNPLDQRYPFASIHSQVAQAADAAGARTVDLLPLYRGLRWDLLVVDGANDEHPNEIAHRIAANALSRAVDAVLTPGSGTAAVNARARRSESPAKP